MVDALIVGAGMAGCVMAERLALAGRSVLLVDRKPHVGGSAYDCYDDKGVLVQQHGAHIFHTKSQQVYAYLSRFTAWRQYEHRVLARVEDEYYPFPINLDTVNRLYDLNLDEPGLIVWLQERIEPRAPILSSEDAVVSRVGRDLFERFYAGYTRKQWGRPASELSASVAARIPIRTNRDDRYFDTVYQGMPVDGFTAMFQRMLVHPNITILLNTDWSELRSMSYGHLVFTGPIDEYYGHADGRLPYRSLTFEYETIPSAVPILPAAVINYPSELIPWTKQTEFRQLTGQQHDWTTISYEFPSADGEPYYPLPCPESREMMAIYSDRARRDAGKVMFIGRLGSYRYYDLDQVAAQALAAAERLGASACAS